MIPPSAPSPTASSPLSPSSSPSIVPVLGQLDYGWDLFGLGFGAFTTDEMQGLALVRDDRLDLLALLAETPGTGQLSRFLRACQATYRVIVVYEIENLSLPFKLKHLGFHLAHEFYEGEPHFVMRWERA